MGNPFGDLFNDTRRVVGAGLRDGADLVGDGLNAAGLHGAAQTVDTLGDQAGYHLGADVTELQLGQTSDPAELVHGDPGAIRSSASGLRTFSGAFGETADGLRGLDTAHWTGAAADAFRAKFAPHPAQWQDAASATSTAAGALESYAGAVESAQGQARQAITLYEQAQQATANAQAAYNGQIAAYNSAAQAYNATLANGKDPGPAPAEPGAFSDPGAVMREQAARMLGAARSARDSAAASAASAIRPATGLAPAEPSFWSQVAGDFMDGMQVASLAGISFTGGIVTGAADIVKFARTLDPMDQWNIEHPAEYAAGLSSTAAGLAEAGADPGRLVQGLAGTGWDSDPFAAAGRLVPNIALAAGTDGAGTAADAAGIAERAALGSGEDAGALSGVADDPELAAQPPGNTVTAGDPIDVVTGDVVLDVTDLTLPGALPLVLQRRHRSSWRAGRWFGPSWMSSFDQRLQVSEDRVIGVFDDGRVLVWPRPDDGPPGDADGESEPVRPVAGAPWPLRRHRGGGWTVTDPQRGLTWWYEPRDGYFRSAAGEGELPLVAVTDRAGHEISFGYDHAGAPAGIRHSGGYHVEVAVTDGRITTLACGGTGAGRTGTGGTTRLRYGYDADGNLSTVVNASGEPLRYYYDAAGRLTGWQDRTGSGYAYQYDRLGRCVRGDGPGGALSGTVRYDPGARITTWTDSSGAVTTYHLDGAYVVAMTDPLGHLSRWQHDRRGHLTERTDPLGRVTRYGYDVDGNLCALTRPDGSQARAAYDDRGLPLQVTDPAGHNWEQEYDERGQRISLTTPDGGVTRFGYDSHGHLACVTGPDGAVTAVRCDRTGLPVELAGPDGAGTRVERDPLGRVSRLTGPDGGVTELTWTADGQPASRVFPDGRAEFWDYDADGHLTRHLTPAGGLTRYEYGPFGQVAAMTGPDGARTQFRYDHGLRLTSVVHEGLTWSYEYDAAGQLVAETDYNGASTSYAHDPASQLTSQVNACGQRVAFRHDQLGNVTERISGGTTTTFGYDLAGRLVYARNPDAEVWLDRDPAGRVTAETCNGRTMMSGYDSAGRRLRRVTPFGAVSTWEYDAAGQPVRLTSSEHEIGFGYDRAGREIRRDLPGGLALAQSWDACGRLTLQALTAGPAQPEGPVADPEDGRSLRQRRGYAYNCDGLITGIDDLLNGARTVRLDRSGRVTAVAGPDWAEQYAYDPAGNLTAASWPQSDSRSAPRPRADTDGAQGHREVTGTLVTRAGNVRYRHDRQGRMVQRQVTRISRRPDVWQYQWDAESRLAAVTSPDHTVWRYRYDPFGRRIAKQRLGPDGEVAEQTDFSWDGPVLAEQATTVRTGDAVRHQVVSWDYRPGSFTPLTQAEHSCASELSEAPQEQIDRRFYAIVTDLVGTPAELIAPDGTLAGSQQHTLWGNTQWRPGGARSPLGFPGQYADPETGLCYNQHRYYDPAAGAYLTPDPLGLAPAPNPHAYVANPMVLADPLGLTPYATGEVGVDTNSLIRGLDFGELDKLGTALAGRAPVVSPQALSEYLERGNAARLGDFLTSQGGRIGSQVSEEAAAALRARANSLLDQFGNARALGVKDSFVVGSAMRDGVSLVTADRQVIGFLRAIGYSVEPFG